MDDVTLVASSYRVAVDLTLAFERGSWEIPAGASDYEPVRAPDRAVVGRVLVERADHTVMTATAAGLTVTPVGPKEARASVVSGGL